MSSPGYQRLDPDARREQILHSARRLFAERTYAAVGTLEIAEAAGVTWGLIAHYFGGKRGLYLAVVRSLVEMPEELPEPEGESPEERIAALVEFLLGVIERNSQTWLAAISGWDIGRDEELAGILEQAHESIIDRMLQILGPEVPPVPDDIVRAVARVGLGAMVSATREWLVGERLTREQVLVLMTRMLNMLMRETVSDVARANRPSSRKPGRRR